MDAIKFLNQLDADQLQAFAAEVETSVGTLRNVKGGKKMGPELAARFEAASARRGEHQTVYRWVSVPERWHVIWPELVKHPKAPHPPNRRNTRRRADAVGATR